MGDLPRWFWAIALGHWRLSRKHPLSVGNVVRDLCNRLQSANHLILAHSFASSVCNDVSQLPKC